MFSKEYIQRIFAYFQTLFSSSWPTWHPSGFMKVEPKKRVLKVEFSLSWSPWRWESLRRVHRKKKKSFSESYQRHPRLIFFYLPRPILKKIWFRSLFYSSESRRDDTSLVPLNLEFQRTLNLRLCTPSFLLTSLLSFSPRFKNVLRFFREETGVWSTSLIKCYILKLISWKKRKNGVFDRGSACHRRDRRTFKEVRPILRNF